jgi:hypothetical protein
MRWRYSLRYSVWYSVRYSVWYSLRYSVTTRDSVAVCNSRSCEIVNSAKLLSSVFGLVRVHCIQIFNSQHSPNNFVQRLFFLKPKAMWKLTRALVDAVTVCCCSRLLRECVSFSEIRRSRNCRHCSVYDTRLTKWRLYCARLEVVFRFAD